MILNFVASVVFGSVGVTLIRIAFHIASQPPARDAPGIVYNSRENRIEPKVRKQPVRQVR